jgi:hypothetical protein
MEFEIKKKTLVFIDETGDHSLEKIDSDFPVFAIAGVIFDPTDYPDAVFRFNRLKLNYFNHEGVIIHSREIASREGDFVFLNNKERRENFLSEISLQINLTKMSIVGAATKKEELKNRYHNPWNPYDISFHFVLEKIFKYACNEEIDYIHFIAESRGRKEDKELHKVFENFKKKDKTGTIRMFPRFIDEKKLDKIHMRLEFRKKQSNIIGHQIADLVVSPIARTVLKKKDHPSLQYFKDKFIYGMANGLKIFP